MDLSIHSLTFYPYMCQRERAPMYKWYPIGCVYICVYNVFVIMMMKMYVCVVVVWWVGGGGEGDDDEGR